MNEYSGMAIEFFPVSPGILKQARFQAANIKKNERFDESNAFLVSNCISQTSSER
jgi:hypothetical protein